MPGRAFAAGARPGFDLQLRGEDRFIVGREREGKQEKEHGKSEKSRHCEDLRTRG
jgi:hypothetical protein